MPAMPGAAPSLPQFVQPPPQFAPQPPPQFAPQPPPQFAPQPPQFAPQPPQLGPAPVRASGYTPPSAYDMVAAASYDKMVRRIIWIAVVIAVIAAVVIATR
jgi:hypothetical protein